MMFCQKEEIDHVLGNHKKNSFLPLDFKTILSKH